MVARTLQKALPDLVYISLTIMLILPILAVALCLFETHHDDGWLSYRGPHLSHDHLSHSLLPWMSKEV